MATIDQLSDAIEVLIHEWERRENRWDTEVDVVREERCPVINLTTSPAADQG